MRKVKVMALRASVNEDQRKVLKGIYPDGTKFDDFRMDPVDADHHYENCKRRLDPATDIVILPKDKPIPGTAMKNGFRHVVVMADSVPRILLEMIVVFGKFNPSQSMGEAMDEHFQRLTEQVGALRLAIDIISGAAPVSPEVNVSELNTLFGLIDEIQCRLDNSEKITVIKRGTLDIKQLARNVDDEAGH